MLFDTSYAPVRQTEKVTFIEYDSNYEQYYEDNNIEVITVIQEPSVNWAAVIFTAIFFVGGLLYLEASVIATTIAPQKLFLLRTGGILMLWIALNLALFIHPAKLKGKLDQFNNWIIDFDI